MCKGVSEPYWPGDDLTLKDIFENPPLGNELATHVVLVNFMIDLPWLCQQCPSLLRVPRLSVLYGDGGEACRQVEKQRTSMGLLTSLHSPALPLQWGTHHSKIVLLLYKNCLRVCIRTFNDIFADVYDKSNAMFIQDFPEIQDRVGSDDEFGRDFLLELEKYFKACGGFDPAALHAYDFSTAAVAIVSSVPGYHTSGQLHAWGHLRLRKLLGQHSQGSQRLGLDDGIICQASSFGALSKKWMEEFCVTLSTTATADGKLLKHKQPTVTFVAPTVGQVRDSTEGWVSSASLFIKRATVSAWPALWRRWGPKSQGRDVRDLRLKHRAMAMPHLKTLCRYVTFDGNDGDAALSWLYVGSHNMSKSAWGEVQKGGSQICVRSYEMGVMYFPSRLSTLKQDMSRGGFFLQPVCPEAHIGAVFVPVAWSSAQAVISGRGMRALPMVFPIAIPPAPPPTADDPTWSRDLAAEAYAGLDRFGTRFGERGPEFYGHRAVVQRAKESVGRQLVL